MSATSQRLRIAAYHLNIALRALDGEELPEGRTRDIVQHTAARLRNSRRALRAEARELERWAVENEQ